MHARNRTVTKDKTVNRLINEEFGEVLDNLINSRNEELAEMVSRQLPSSVPDSEIELG